MRILDEGDRDDANSVASPDRGITGIQGRRLPIPYPLWSFGSRPEAVLIPTASVEATGSAVGIHANPAPHAARQKESRFVTPARRLMQPSKWGEQPGVRLGGPDLREPESMARCAVPAVQRKIHDPQQCLTIKWLGKKSSRPEIRWEVGRRVSGHEYHG